GRIHRFLKQGNYCRRLGSGAPVFLAAVLQYLTVEVLELAGDAARKIGQRRITPRDLKMVAEADAEINKLLRDVTIPGGG
ncbi:histone-fold-containing protein, partial [Coprinopsis marcescibilis]